MNIKIDILGMPVDRLPYLCFPRHACQGASLVSPRMSRFVDMIMALTSLDGALDSSKSLFRTKRWIGDAAAGVVGTSGAPQTSTRRGNSPSMSIWRSYRSQI